jgi:hypothetical protein
MLDLRKINRPLMGAKAKTQGAKTQGAKTQGAKTQGARTQGARTQGATTAVMPALPMIGEKRVAWFREQLAGDGVVLRLPNWELTRLHLYQQPNDHQRVLRSFCGLNFNVSDTEEPNGCLWRNIIRACYRKGIMREPQLCASCLKAQARQEQRETDG